MEAQQQKQQDKNQHSTCKPQNYNNNSISHDYIFDRVTQYLDSLSVKYKIMEHQQVRTSQEAAEVRNTPLEWGSKTMLIKSPLSQIPILLVYRAHLQLDWKKIKKIPFIGKKMKMLTDQEVEEFGVKPGGVPPFSHLLKKPAKTVLDERFEEVKNMVFNAGAKNKSVVIQGNIQKWENCQRFSITVDPPQQKVQNTQHLSDK